MSTIAELVRANFREELVRWYRYRSSSSLPLDELYEHSPAARRYEDVLWPEAASDETKKRTAFAGTAISIV